MHKEEICRRYVEMFDWLLSESDEEKQKEIGEEIARYSGEIGGIIEKNFGSTKLQEIQESCLPMEHWKDDTGYCNLNEEDIKKFCSDLEEILVEATYKREGNNLNFPKLESLTEDLSGYQLDDVIKILENCEYETTKENRFDKLHIIYNAEGQKILKAIQKIKTKLYDKLDNLSVEQLHKLADLMGVGFDPEDKDEMVMVLFTEPPSKIEEALRKLDG